MTLARRKIWIRSGRQNYARKIFKQACNEDIVNRLLLTFDPRLTSLRVQLKRKTIPFLEDALNLLLPPEFSIVQNEEEENEDEENEGANEVEGEAECEDLELDENEDEDENESEGKVDDENANEDEDEDEDKGKDEEES